jgi:hypothetical protein
VRLELTILSALVPKTNVYTIPPRAHQFLRTPGRIRTDTTKGLSLVPPAVGLRAHTMNISSVDLVGVEPTIRYRSIVGFQ